MRRAPSPSSPSFSLPFPIRPGALSRSGTALLCLEHVQSARNGPKVDAQAVFDLTDWRTASDDVTVAFVPAPDGE
jgi:hypothetical protein